MSEFTEKMNAVQEEVEIEQVEKLVVSETTTGYVTGNRLVLSQLVHSKAVQIMKKYNVCLRKTELYNWSDRRPLESIPKHIYDECFDGHDFLIGRKVKGKKKTNYQPVNGGSLRMLQHQMTSPTLKNKLEETLALPEVKYDNELTGIEEEKKAIESGQIFVPPVTCKASEAVLAEVRSLFYGWIDWMEKNAPDQLNFLHQIGVGYCFGNRYHVNHLPKINFGVGSNRSGKGTFITMLDCIPNMARYPSWQPTDCASEYRHGSIFVEGATMSVCHEWRNVENMDNFIALAKQSVRKGEAITVRDVGAATKQIYCKADMVIFFNSAHRDDKMRALHESYELLAKWDAYDRMNVVFIDWGHKFEQSEYKKIHRWISEETPQEERAVWGVCLYDYLSKVAQSKRTTYPIPDEFAESRSTSKLNAWERALIGLHAAFEELRQWELSQREKGALASEYSEQGTVRMRAAVRQLFNRDHSDTFELLVNADGIEYVVYASWLNNALASKRCNSGVKWLIPAALDNKIEKAILHSRLKQRVCVFKFDTDAKK